MTETFLRITSDGLLKMVMNEFGKVFSVHKETLLYKGGSQSIRNFLDAALAKQQVTAERAFKLEHSKPFTMDKPALTQATQAAAAFLLETRLDIRRDNLLIQQEEAGLRPVTEGEARRKEMRKIPERDLGRDDFINEIRTMAARCPHSSLMPC